MAVSFPAGNGASTYGTPAKGAWETVVESIARTHHGGAAPTYAPGPSPYASSRLPWYSAEVVARFAKYTAAVAGALVGLSIVNQILKNTALGELMPLVTLGVIGYSIWRFRRGWPTGAASAAVGGTVTSGARQHAEQVLSEFRRTRNPELIPEDARSWAYGALSEERVGGLLNAMTGFEVAHDLEIIKPNGAVGANIDHLVTGRTGVFMVDTKRWSGTLCRKGNTFGTREGGPSEQYRAKAPDTLRYEAGNVPGGVDLIIVAVDGRGTIEDGRVYLDSPGEVPILAVKSEELTEVIFRQRFSPGPPMRDLLQPPLRLS